MLITRRNPIPKSWIFMAILPWAAITFQTQVMGTAFTFSLSKFVENPASLTFILSFPGFISLGLAPMAQMMSDRIWTRCGRRKPFIITGGFGMYGGLLGMAFASNATWLIAGYALYAISADLSGPIEPLKQEIVPPPQRGEATAVMQWLSNLSSLLFFTVVLGRFDEVNSLAGIPFTGEFAAYAACVMLGVSMLFIIILGVKELDPHSVLRGQRITVRNVLAGLFDHEFLPVYLLVFSAAILSAGLGPLGALLQTEQFGMTKQQMGYNVAVGTTLNLLIFIPLIGVFSDRINRMRAYQILICTALTIKILFYFYVEFVLVDHRASWQEQVIFGEMLSVCSILMQVVFLPLVYDYIRRDKMGTYAAGANILMRLTGVITLNGVGLFVMGYSTALRPPAGEMVRVALAAERPVAAVRATLDPSWVANTWRATGADFATGRAYEIRSRNPDSKKLSDQRQALAAERSGLEKVTQRRPAEQSRLDEVQRQIAAIDQQLQARADAFRQAVVHRLGDRLLRDGDQIRSAAVSDGALVTLPLARRPTTMAVERALHQLRAQRADVIDLQLVKRDTGFAVNLGVTAPAGMENRLRAALNAAAPGVVGPAAATITPGRVLRLDLLVVEEPLDLFASPLNRWIINPIKGWFDAAPMPDQRLNALGRSLRLKGATEQVRVDAGPNGEKAILITALLDPAAPANTQADVVSTRLGAWLPPATVPQARAFYARVATFAAAQRLTVAQPVLKSGFAPLKYDYMSGYLFMFALAAVGLVLTFWFCRMEKRGLVRKHGRDEAAAEKAIHDKIVAASAHPGRDFGSYVPGYFWVKIGVMLLGLSLLTFAAAQLWTPVRLLLTGQRAQAEAVRVIKSRPGGETLSFAEDTLAREAEEARDRSWWFATEFRYATGEHSEELVVCPVRNQLHPVFRLLDEDGLPSSVPVWYDPARPRTVVFPAMIGTWFLPMMVLLFGIMNSYVGAMLAATARRPIELPPPPVDSSVV